MTWSRLVCPRAAYIGARTRRLTEEVAVLVLEKEVRIFGLGQIYPSERVNIPSAEYPF
jgi:hypothetical protein